MKATKDKDGKYSLENWEAGGISVIQPKSGSAYTVGAPIMPLNPWKWF